MDVQTRSSQLFVDQHEAADNSSADNFYFHLQISRISPSTVKNCFAKCAWWERNDIYLGLHVEKFFLQM